MDEHVLTPNQHKRIEWSPSGVCSKMFFIDIHTDPQQGDRIENIEIFGGCPGNAKALCVLLKGMLVSEAIEKLQGIKCGSKSTSCPDQLADALKAGESNC